MCISDKPKVEGVITDTVVNFEQAESKRTGAKPTSTTAEPMFTIASVKTEIATEVTDATRDAMKELSILKGAVTQLSNSRLKKISTSAD